MGGLRLPDGQTNYSIVEITQIKGPYHRVYPGTAHLERDTALVWYRLIEMAGSLAIIMKCYRDLTRHQLELR